MEVNFRTLKANEIDTRVGNVDKNKKWITLLLYKDARVDMDMLDETVGPMNWKRKHERDNSNCIVSIYDDEKKEWVSKEDCGKESNNDAEKGLASDSFKRACVNWGIGRELYTAPKIFLYGNSDDLKSNNYSVKEIGYDENKAINKLIIVDKEDKVIFQFPKGKKTAVVKKETTETKNEIRMITKSQITKIHTLIGKNEPLKEGIYKKFKVKSSKELTEDDAKKMIKILEDGIAKKKASEENKD